MQVIFLSYSLMFNVHNCIIRKPGIFQPIQFLQIRRPCYEIRSDLDKSG